VLGNSSCITTSSTRVCVCVCVCLKSVCAYLTKTKKNVLQPSSSVSATCDSLLRPNPAKTFLIFNMLFSKRKTINILLLPPHSAFYRFCESSAWKTHEFAFHNNLSQKKLQIFLYYIMEQPLQS